MQMVEVLGENATKNQDTANMKKHNRIFALRPMMVKRKTFIKVLNIPTTRVIEPGIEKVTL